jgi:hypothetical protein
VLKFVGACDMKVLSIPALEPQKRNPFHLINDFQFVFTVQFADIG